MAQRVAGQLGNYHLIKLVGDDGFTENYLGEHHKSRALAIIKVLYTQLMGDGVERFLSEARPLVNLMHLHILRVLEFGVEEGTPFLVVEYAPHGNLRQRHSKGTRLPLSTVIEYVKQVADGLKYAHERNLIHRDIKPENMQLDRHDKVLLSDFSADLIARISSRGDSPEIAGTILYMAPEQIEGKPIPASDQYSLGAVVYEWLSGRCPFEGSFNEIAVQHLMSPPPPLHELFPMISPELELVVMTALAKDPKNRFGTIHAFANALSQVRQADMTRPFTPSYAINPLPNADAPVIGAVREAHNNALAPVTPSSSTPHLLTVSTALVTPPIGGPAISPVNLSGGQVTPVVSPVIPLTRTPVSGINQHQDASPISEQSTTRGQGVSRRSVVAGLVGVGLVAATGGLVWQTQRLLGSHPSFTAMSTPTSKPTPSPKPPIAPGSNVVNTSLLTYSGHTDQIQTVAWSPNGLRIASGSFDMTVRIWDAFTGQHSFVYHGHTANLRSVKWSLPDGRLIASASDDWTVQVWNPTTGSIITDFKKHTAAVHSIAWSPDGTRIASGSDDATVQVWEALTGKLLVTYLGHSDSVRGVAWSHDGTRIVSGGYDTDVHVWEAATGNLLLIYSNHTGTVSHLAWSPNDKRIASASWDTTVQVWDSTTGKRFINYKDHNQAVWTVAWSPDGKYIVSGGPDKTAQICDANTGKAIITYLGHRDSVVDVAWSPDSKFVVSGSTDKTVQIWKATLS